MKGPHLAAALVLGATALSIASPASAQSSVTVYGVADGSVSFDKGGGPSLATTRVTSGVMRASRLGFRGTEDLGGGLKAVFQWEMGVDLDTGLMKSYAGDYSTATPAAPGGTTGTGFNRRSYAGLETPYGALTLGRDYTPWFWVGLYTDPFGFGLYGNLQTAAPLTGTGAERFARASNAIFYVSPNFGGFVGRAMYSFGSESFDTAGSPPRSANTMASLGGEYTVGKLFVAGAYTETKLPQVAGGAFTGTGTRKDWIVGAKYTMDRFVLSGGYMKVKQPTPTSDGSDAYFGGWWLLGPGRLGLMGQRLKLQSTAGDRTANAYGAAYVYPLSKRTDVYASLGLTRNNAIGLFNVVSSDAQVAAGQAGANPRAFALGVSHTF